MSLSNSEKQSSNQTPVDAAMVKILIDAAASGERERKKETTADEIKFTQWGCAPNDVFHPATNTVSRIPPGIYTVHTVQGAIFFKGMKVNTDALILLEDTPSKYVIEGIRKFWAQKSKYEEYGILYRRGLLLSGPPGSGKTASVAMLSKELVEAGGIVVYVSNPELSALGLQQLREIEPDRPIICIFEDIDEMVDYHGEHALLALLDGEYQIANVTNLATTNYADKLGARIINRPSRFDEHITIDMPCESSRRHYLRHITRTMPLDDDTTEKWVKDTAGFSIAHLRELMIAVKCLDQPYDTVLKRLKSMWVKPKATKEFKPMLDNFGFGGRDKDRED